jgi:hypothetical protein
MTPMERKEQTSRIVFKLSSVPWAMSEFSEWLRLEIEQLHEEFESAEGTTDIYRAQGKIAFAREILRQIKRVGGGA